MTAQSLVNSYWQATGGPSGQKVRYGVAGVAGYLVFGFTGAAVAALSNLLFLEGASAGGPPYPEAAPAGSVVDDLLSRAKALTGYT